MRASFLTTCKNPSTFFIIILGLFLSANVVAFTYMCSIPLVKSDGWRFIEIYLAPWYSNHFDWRVLWSDHHPQPLTGILFIVNAIYLDLSMQYESYLSIAFLPVVSLLLGKAADRTINDGQQNDKVRFIMYLLVLFSVFSFNSTTVYVWSLVSNNIITTAILIGFLVYCDRLVVKQGWSIGDGAKLAAATFLVLVLFTDKAKLYIIALAGMLLLNVVVRHNWTHARWIALLALTVIVHHSLLNSLVGESPGVKQPATIGNIWAHIPQYFDYIALGISSSWLNTKALHAHAGVPVAVLKTVAYTILLLYLFSFYLFFRNRLFEKTLLPGVFILVAGFTALGGALYRFDPTGAAELAGHVPRYYLTYFLGVIAVFWILLYSIRFRSFTCLSSRSVLALATAFIAWQFVASAAAWQHSPYIRLTIVRSHDIMIANSEGDDTQRPPRFITGSNYPTRYKQGLAFLKRHDLNLFSRPDFVERYRDHSS